VASESRRNEEQTGNYFLEKNCNPVEFEKFITRVSGNVYQMETWTNDMGRLEKADQMDENDFLVENNLIGFRCKRNNSSDPFGDCGNCALSSYIDGVLDELQNRKNELEGHLQSHSSIWGSLVAIFAIFASYAQ